MIGGESSVTGKNTALHIKNFTLHKSVKIDVKIQFQMIDECFGTFQI